MKGIIRRHFLSPPGLEDFMMEYSLLLPSTPSFTSPYFWFLKFSLSLFLYLPSSPSRLLFLISHPFSSWGIVPENFSNFWRMFVSFGVFYAHKSTSNALDLCLSSAMSNGGCTVEQYSTWAQKPQSGVPPFVKSTNTGISVNLSRFILPVLFFDDSSSSSVLLTSISFRWSVLQSITLEFFCENWMRFDAKRESFNTWNFFTLFY